MSESGADQPRPSPKESLLIRVKNRFSRRVINNPLPPSVTQPAAEAVLPQEPAIKSIIDKKADPIYQLDSLIKDDQLVDPSQLDQLVGELAAYPDLTYTQGKVIFERLGKVSKVFTRNPFFNSPEEKGQHDQAFREAEKKLRRYTRISEDIDGLHKAIEGNPEFDKVDYSKLVDSNNPFYKFVIGSDRKKYYFDKESGAVRRRYDGADVRTALQREISSSRDFKGRLERFGNLALEKAIGWIQLDPKGGTSAKTNGRLYINQNFEIQTPSTPRGVTDIFWGLSEIFNSKPELFTSIKVYDFDQRGSWAFSGVDTVIEDLNRSDKIVAYFDTTKKQEIFDYFSLMFSGQDEAMSLDPVIPRFTEPTPWGGIGFAEEVDEKFVKAGLSRNQLIAQVLQETVRSVPSEDRNVFDRVLQENFRRFKINPNNPAYNLKEKD